MKKKPVIAGIIILAAIVAATVYFSQPENIVSVADKYTIFRVAYNGVDVTGRVDCKALAAIVSKYQRSRVPRSIPLYQDSQVVVELDGASGNKPLFVLLGEMNIAYGIGNTSGFTIRNSAALLAEIKSLLPQQTDEELGLKEKKFITFSDGESADLWQQEHSGTADYKLSDGTVLLSVQDPTGPDKAYVGGGMESFDDLSEPAKIAVSAYYKEQGLLYDTRSELEKAYAAYLSCKKSGTAYKTRYISQDISPAASNDTIMSFLTSVTLPLTDQESQEIRRGAVFDRKTGKALSNWELFNIPEEAARKKLLDLFDIDDPALKAEMQAALKPEYITLFPKNLEVSFPAGALPSQQHRYDVGIDYNKLRSVLQPWAIPKTPVK